MSRVTKCMCEECHYNQKQECRADGIEVKSSGDMKVNTTDGTCCNTFRPKSVSF